MAFDGTPQEQRFDEPVGGGLSGAVSAEQATDTKKGRAAIDGHRSRLEKLRGGAVAWYEGPVPCGGLASRGEGR